MSCRHDTIVVCTRSAFGGAQATISMCLRTAHHESAAPKLSNTDNVKENNIMNKANFNVVGNNENTLLAMQEYFSHNKRFDFMETGDFFEALNNILDGIDSELNYINEAKAEIYDYISKKNKLTKEKNRKD